MAPVSVLLVEDDERLAQLIAEVLGDDGYEVTAAAGPHEALVALDEGEYSVILFDLLMTGMDGQAFYEQVRARGLETPAILMTAWRDGERIAGELGVGFLRKPFELDELSAAVQAAAVKGSGTEP